MDEKWTELTLSVSGICKGKDNKKSAYVSFEDSERFAEGKIPNCVIINNKGFTEAEAAILEKYMRDHLPELKDMAAKNNIMTAFSGKK